MNEPRARVVLRRGYRAPHRDTSSVHRVASAAGPFSDVPACGTKIGPAMGDRWAGEIRDLPPWEPRSWCHHARCFPEGEPT